MRAFIAIFCILTTSYTALASEGFSYKAEAFARNSSSAVPSVETFQEIYQKKCIWPPKVVQPCFLNEKDVSTKGRADRILLFRGESTAKSLPVTSHFYRWAISDKGICQSCQESELTKYLFESAKPLEKGFEFPVYFRKQDRSWRDESGRLASLSKEPKKTVVEILARTHKIEYGIYFEEDKKMFDALVSFSVDPFVADLFARKRENGQGAIWIASVPSSAFMILQKKDCKMQTLAVGKIYDFNACIDEAISQQEAEMNAYLYLPTEYFYGKILNR